MKTPININGNDLVSFLATQTKFVMADLFTISLKNGNILHYTDFQTQITVQGITYLAGHPNISRSRISESVGFAVSTMTLTVTASLTDILGGQAVLYGIKRGDWSGANVLVYRLYMDSAFNPIGMFIRFLGQIASLDNCGRTLAKFTVKAKTEELNVKLPKNVIQPGCFHTLYDAGCRLEKASFAHSGSVQSGSTLISIFCNLSSVSGYFDLGELVFTSGPNVGISSSIKSYIFGSPSSVITIVKALSILPTIGDTFIAYPGCNKTQATCTTKFNNIENFGGFPFVPAPETAL